MEEGRAIKEGESCFGRTFLGSLFNTQIDARKSSSKWQDFKTDMRENWKKAKS